jgi:beta-barrel assembly-enhancing protease
MKKFIYTAFLLLLSAGIFTACDKNDNFVIMSPQEELELGKQVSEEIESKPNEYPVLSEDDYPEAYDYLNTIVDRILNSGKVQYKNEFVWDVNIIYDDEVLNAFATPGGYIYVYTGLIKYLDKEDDLAGVLGHEIAHADLRHSARQLQKMYGLDLLTKIIFGEESSSEIGDITKQIAGTLAGLKFSRDHESEADAASVVYLSETEYQCNGAYSFFQKMLDNNQTAGVPEFLSTHPDPKDRVDDINAKADEIGCDKTPWDPATYQDFKNMLP